MQRRKEMRTQGASRYKRKVHFLKNIERGEHVSIPKTDGQIEGVLTPWRRSGTKLGHRRELTKQGTLTD